MKIILLRYALTIVMKIEFVQEITKLKVSRCT